MCDNHAEQDTIRAHITLRTLESTERNQLGTEWLMPRGILRYDPAEPYAVTLLCHAEWGLIWWTFGRDLLSAGTLTAAGEGDVRITPAIADGTMRFDLDSPNGSLTVEAPIVDVADFLELTFDVVPVGSESEHLDLDRELATFKG